MIQWLDRCPLPNAWLQLDEDDHEIPAFLIGVVTSLRQLFPGCFQQTADLLHAQSSVPLKVWKSALIGDLELLEDTPFVLALDDYHLVGNPAIDLLLTDVLQSEPFALHLILSARRSTSLSFSRLRVQGQILEISTADLRFTGAEAALYLDRATHVSLNPSIVQKIHEKTEGWAAGLALVAISLRNDIDPEDLVANQSELGSNLSDYLIDQVFNNQPREIQEFLLKTATFSQFCASLLHEVFGFEQSEGEIQTLLEQIEAAQLFLISLDTQRTWYRYHHLFRQLLLSRQHYSFHSDQIALYRRRAAVWLIRQGQLEEALDHLIAVQDWTEAAQLVESRLNSLLNAEDFLGIKRQLGHFSEDFIASRPGLLLMQAWIAHFGLRIPRLRVLTTQIQAILDAAREPSEGSGSMPLPGFETLDVKTVQAQVWTLDSLIYYLSNRGDLAMPLAHRGVEALPGTWRFARGNAMIYLGLSMFMEGQYRQVVEMLQQEYESLQDPSSTYGARMQFCLSVIYLLNGDLELCRQTAEQMLRNALTYNLLLMQGWGYYLLGRVYQEWNQLELAADHYRQVVDQRFTSNLMPSLESIAGYAYMLQCLGRGEQAMQFLGSLEQFHGELTGTMPPLVMSLMAWLQLQSGSQAEARRWAESFTTPVAEQAIVWAHIPHVYKAKILLATADPATVREVDQLLDEIQKLAERTHNKYTLIRVLAMRAACQARQGNHAAAQQTLERALRLGRPGRFIHAFVEQGPEMLKLLQALSQRLKNQSGLEEYLSAIKAGFSKPTGPQAAIDSRAEIKTRLTDREFEVLELLVKRLSINEISNRLFISPSTVQQHTHHIYRKLNVANKRQAVARAIELGIIPPER